MRQHGSGAVELGVERPLLASADAVPLARRAVADLARRCGATADVVDDVRLAVTEACANVVLHAYVDPGPIEVRAQAADGLLSVQVRDWGRGMRTQSGRAGLGLGLRLIATVCSSLEACDAVPGTELRMTFRLGA